VGLRIVALLVAVLALAVPATGAPGGTSVSYLLARQGADGGFAEPAGSSDPTLSAWALLALEAAGPQAFGRERKEIAVEYLLRQPAPGAAALSLRILALSAAGARVEALVERLGSFRRPDGRIGPLVNSTIWSVLALRSAGRPAGTQTLGYLRRQQGRGGGWSWAPGGAADSNDTAAAIQALRAAGVGGTPIARGLTYLRRLQNRDGGFALVRGRPSDTQSTAWAIQAFLAAGKRPPRGAYPFLARLRRVDGSYRYSARYVTTPAWVTAQVLPALARKPFPLR